MFGWTNDSHNTPRRMPELMCPGSWISPLETTSMEIRTFVHPTVPIRLINPSRVHLYWSFSWNHDQTTELTVPELVFSGQIDILRPTVKPDLAWVVKKPKTDMHSHPADHPDSPASVLIFTPCIHLIVGISRAILHLLAIISIHLSSRSVIAFSDHIQHPAKVIIQFRMYQVVSEPLWLRNPGGVVEEKPCWLKRNPALGQLRRIHIKNLFIFLSLFFFPQKMFGLFKKSKPQQDVYFPFKTVLEKKKQMVIGNKKQFDSNGFDFVQKQRNQKNRQNRFDDDEKWVRNGDRPFTKAKRSNHDVFDQNELQTYVSLKKMLHKEIHAIRHLKKKGNTNTSPPPKHQTDQHGDQDVMNNLNKVCSSDHTDHTDRAVPRASRLDLRLEPRPDDRTDHTGVRLPRPSRHSKTHGRARLSLGREETKDVHAFSSGRPSEQFRKCPYLYPVHPSGSDELGHYLKGHL
ncbi:hypothetical protein IGI04_023382 [Brassica rapa subsp. trilocularis]|uniref:Uncharacterized protein n=1 Tax=Brassica rapa subsp. trilocularis TaxID=1813537 RepID=A0ABQ7M733_BRACM|nr:hypothetical protein IGI04_023382 [Brassica rapa subsp. trilocularis]